MKKQLVLGLFVLGLVVAGSIVANRHNAGASVNQIRPAVMADGEPPPPPPLPPLQCDLQKTPWLVADGEPPPPPPKPTPWLV